VRAALLAVLGVLAVVPAASAATLQLGAADQPGGASALKREARVAMRYQYLAGGVDTGSGWSTWNENGTFVSRYIAESRRARLVPVLTYYMLLQSKPERGGGELEKDLTNLRDPELMRRYYDDLRLALRRAAGRTRVVLHIEPDLWGYVQMRARGDDATTIPAAVASSGDPDLAGLPDTAAGFAQAVVRLRDRTARNVRLAWHLSTWGTNDSPTANDHPPAKIAELARRSARFYRSLGTRFDLVFNDVADRDDGFREVVLGERPARDRWTPADFRRHLALWQLPLGNSRLPNEWQRYRDTRVEWFLGSRAHLRATARAGIVALLFGGGADGCTTRQTDGGLFDRLARRYARRPLRLG
jgi:hypothetical protein